ncbi:MAG: hypothetical protein ABR540_07310 [Acidimicrobiales bacterium]
MRAITLDAYYPNRHLSAYLAHDFYGVFQPLNSSLVAIGAFTPPPQGSALPFEVVHVENPGADGAKDRFASIAFAFGYLFIRIVFEADPGADRALKLLIPADDPALLTCWPNHTPGDLSWPPTEILDMSAFISLTGI